MRSWWGRRIRLTNLIVVSLAAFLGGLVLARFIQISGWWTFPAVSSLVVLVRRRGLEALLCVLLAGGVMGWWRGSVYIRQLGNYQRLADKKVTLEVTANDDAVYSDKSQLGFDGSDVTVIHPYYQKLIGKVKIAGFGEAAVYRGDRVKVSGKVFLTRGSRQASISFGELKVVSHYHSPVETVRHNFNAGTFSALPEPQASFGLGLLIGQRDTLPQSISTQLATVGLTHLIAVSGYNLTILMDAARRLLGKRSKYQSLILSFALIGGFLLFTGSSPSIVRAAIVSVLSLLAWYFGRTIKPLMVILLAAVITTWMNPLYLWSDIGWYLSFLAFFGILVLAPLTISRLYRNRPPHIIIVLVIECLCAQAMTIPLILYIFNQMSMVALPANVLVVPFVPLAMLLALIAGLAGAVVPALAGWLAWPARLLLTYMLDMVSLFSRIPHALQRYSLGASGMALLYGSMAGICLILWHKTRPKNGIITPEASRSSAAATGQAD